MSLLLEALKKAERAKEEAELRAKGGEAAVAQPDPDATVAETARHVTTRDELPDISAPLEILSEDIRPGAKAAPAPSHPVLELQDEPAQAPEPKPRPAARRQSARVDSEPKSNTSSERAAAQKVFEAKFKEPNPRLPFFITMGLLGAVCVGTFIYFWLQLRPAPTLVNSNPQRPTDEKAVEVATRPAASPTGAPNTSPTDIPGLPGAPAAATPSAPSAPATSPAGAAPAAPVAAPQPSPAPSAPAATASAPAKAPATAPRPRARPASPPPQDESSVTVSRGGPQVHPKVQAGYAAYQSGDITLARSEYQQALREDPSNRDALLGLAAVETRAGRLDLADGYYQKLLQADPRDAHAQAGAIALRNQQLDPVLAESRVKSLLAADRNANVLYFTLGNQYAQQGRWADAQQAYFRAFAADPANPDFAFNLAVSFDQIRQPQLALEYYRRALELAEKRSASFSLASARVRIQQLSR